MRSFFSPAIALMGRLKYARKLQLLGLMALVACAVVIYGLLTSLNQTIQLSQRQLQGLALIEPATRTIQLVQQYRGISTALLSGSEMLRDRCAAKEAEVGKAFKAMEQALPPSLSAGEDFQYIRQEWEDISKEWRHSTTGKNFTAHTQLIDRLQSFKESYALPLELNPDRPYLLDVAVTALPHALEHLGQIRAFGSSILSGKQIHESQKVEMRVMVVELDHTLKLLNIGIDRISHHNPALHNALRGVFANIDRSVQSIVDTVASDILTGRLTTPPEAFLEMATTEIDKGYAQIYETLLPATKALIKARIATAENTLYLSIGIALLLFTVVAYFAIGNYFVIADSIRSFALAARDVADGNLETRVRLNTRDELSQIAGSFNKMTEEFSATLAARKQDEKRMLRLANYDALTGLPNRTLFRDRLEQEIRKAHRAGLKMALLHIDLDKFKEVNEMFGHAAGDILLQEAASRISGCVREADTVARLGGDEFAVILTELDATDDVERAAESILQYLTEPFHFGEETAYVSASIGITLYPDDATEAEEMLKNTDQAMHSAKSKGRNCFEYFTQSMQQAAQARLQLISELRGALPANQFLLHYQPIVELATGRVDKAEALIRWQHPEFGLVSPAQFIPLAEETGLIAGIGDWVFREAMRQLKLWRELHNARLQISVNVSPAQFGKNTGNPLQAWFGYLRKAGLPGQSMNLEITEGLLLDTEHNISGKLLDCHNEGIQISIDDFGTGYSSLAYLKRFDIDYLKIDKTFVRDLVTDPNDMALCEAIIVMAHKLDLKVIAEGVEMEKQRRLLVEAGCDYAQGYLFSRPLPAEAFEMLLKEQPFEPIPHAYLT